MSAQRRLVDLTIIITAALAATSVIVIAHHDAAVSTAGIAVVMIALLLRFHETRDVAGLIIGATIGNAIELACDAAGIWRHTDRAVLNLAPPYILLCYPILGMAMPRMIEAIAGARRSIFDRIGSVVPIASVQLLAFVILSLTFGQQPSKQTAVCVSLLTVTLWQFHSKHDLITAIAGALVALTWELPATIFGAWSFPTANIAGLIPAWLPAAYAIFFVTLGRLTTVLAAEAETSIERWRGMAWSRERLTDLAIVSSLIAGAVAGVCAFFSMPLACACVSAMVLAIGLYRWRTRADISIAITGAIFGPILEYYATGSTLWIYPYATVGLLPAWVFTLWPAFPLCLVRLTNTLWPQSPSHDRRPALEAAIGLLILLCEIPLLATFGNSRPLFTAGVTTAMLFAAAITVRSPQAVLMLTLSGVFGMLCEILPIKLGAWIYPIASPLPFPLWLPTGYALFGFGIVQLAQGVEGLCDQLAIVIPRRERQTQLNQRRPEHAIAGR
jgi:uncharacterized membrane protein YoaT (DUF817 family)